MATIQLTTRQLRVQFPWQRDRYGQTLAVAAGDGWQPLLTSVEGPDEASWPASGPFQQMTAEPDEHAPQRVFLLGMAGNSHWSASVEPTAAGDLRFDIACRLQQRPARLGSRYRLLPSEQPSAGPAAAILIAEAADSATLHTPDGSLVVRLLPLESEPPLTLAAEGEDLVMGPDLGQLPPLPATVRWRYEISAG